MLIDTITFEMHNTTEKFLVPNTELNFALIAENRFTRQIKFTKTFSFQAEREMKAPAFFIEAFALEYIDEMVAIEESEDFGIDEMVGSY